MTPGILLMFVLALSGIGFAVGRQRALSVAGGDARRLHSRPSYHGAAVLMFTAIPAVILLLAWVFLRPLLAPGVSAVAAPAAVAIAALAGLALSALRIRIDLRARNIVETLVIAILIGCSLIAVATTIGIIISLVFETVHFFQLYPAQDFFLSATWNPRFGGGSDLGLWPLLWGTLYVSLVALVVAVPIGLMAAVYLSEYASRRTRAFAKPAIEVLAGIPTIVYGLFALVTVGPFLRDWLAQPLGLGSSSSSVMTAGLVMGIMLIPFVSSLSDDIMNAVPQAMRDGSYGLGATQSETVRRVVLPAALPGIVGAILLAASRAIGETMIVVMGAGAAARLDLNPFEAMTTITVKIVSQLTGDTEFASPETLVAFALGLTLFCFTLVLNVLAMWIVRKYREQYE
jgi:phosphate transport system permease protein